MSMDATAWSALHRTMNTYDGSHKVTRETLRRIATFACRTSASWSCS